MVMNYLDENPRCRSCGGPVRFYNDQQLQLQRSGSEQEVKEAFSWKCKSGVFTLSRSNFGGDPDEGSAAVST